ncbi:MAG: SRPBCC family protein [Candidatus Sericytochromatia bacterium]|nr:SRPBCC family protein [Candidatus Sericytochromatia bacterium]
MDETVSQPGIRPWHRLAATLIAALACWPFQMVRSELPGYPASGDQAPWTLGVPRATAADNLHVRQFKGAIGSGVEAWLIVHTPPDTVYAVLADPRPSPEFLPYVTNVWIDRQQGNDQVVRYRARHFGLFDVEYSQSRHLQPPDRVSFAQLKGPFKKVEGQWLVAPALEGTRLTYSVQVDPGFFVPGPLQSFFLKQGLPGLINAIKSRAESGGTWKKPG